MKVPVRKSIVLAAARASWLLAFTAMIPVGFSEKGADLLPVASHKLVLVVSGASILAIALGVAALLAMTQEELKSLPKGQAFLGTGAGLILLFVSQAASIAGELSAREAEADLRSMSESAMRDYPGWNGNAPVGAAQAFAIEIDGRSKLAKVLLMPFDRPFLILLVGVDNTAGDRELVLDLDGARVRHETGDDRAALSRSEMRAHVVPGYEKTVAAHLGSYRVPVGARLDNALVLVTPPASMRTARGIEVRIDGAPALIPGRYFDIDDKRAIDSARAAALRGASP